ncbi:MAG: S-layer homology domain-containing protein [Bacillota bacterium]|nr:S-layer homology domain-containing protein [Bacillota bacterium]
MLKKHNKLIMVLVLVTFMFSIVGSASAATFSDVAGNDAEASAVYKLNSLGIIDGYPDGTFGPEKTITRAEFAKIAAYTAGLEAVATGMTGVPSTFSDVATDNWANGWINVASTQGYVKGYPDGTFGPEAQISQAEVITVLLRILGYNDNLAGNWPAGYIAKAANLGVLDDITFLANKAATRGEVAVLGGATLDENTVEYLASDNVFQANTITLLSDNFDKANTVKEVLVKETKLKNNEYAMTVYDFDAEDAADKEYPVTFSKDVVVSGAPSIFAMDGKMIDYVINDDAEAVFVKVRTDAAADVFGKVENYNETARTVEIDDTDYDLADTFFLYDFNDQVGLKVNCDDQTILTTTGDANAWTTILKDKKVTLSFNEDAEVIYIEKLSPNATYVVNTVKDDYIKTKTGTRITGLDKDDVFVTRNGAVVSASDLQEGDLVYWVKDAKRGFDTYLMALSNTVAGEVTKIKGESIYIDGTKYTKAGDTSKQGLYMEDEDEDEVTNVDDFIGEQITAYLDGNNEVAYITGSTGEDQSDIVAVILNSGVDTTKGSKTHWAKLFTENGTEVTYDIDSDYYDDNDTAVDAYLATAKEGTLISVKLNADGEIKDIDLVDSNSVAPIGQTPAKIGSVYSIDNAEKDWDRLDADGYKYVKDDTVIFDMGYTYKLDASDNVTDVVKDDDAKLATWADIEDLGSIFADVYATDDQIDYIVVKNSGGVVSTDINGIFDVAYKTGDDMVDVYVDGELKSYEYDYTDGEDLLQGGIYTVDVDSSNEVTSIAFATETAIGTVREDGIMDGSKSFEIGATTKTTFKTSADTVFVKVNDDELEVSEYDAIDEGDILLVLEGTDADAGTSEIVIILDSESTDYAKIKTAVGVAGTDLD